MEKNFETLEVGRRYENQLGEVVKIVKRDNFLLYPYRDEQGRRYTPQGRHDQYRIDQSRASKYDLVKRLPEQPADRLAELEAKRAELDKEIEELKNSTQTLYCEAFLWNGKDVVLLDISRREKERELKIEESAKDGRHPTIATFDVPFRKVDGKWEAAFEIVPK